MLRFFNIKILSLILLLTGILHAADTCSVKIKYKGVTIVTYNERGMFPGRWLDEPDNGYSLPLDKTHEDRALAIIKTALDKYPEQTLKNNLKKVYLLGELQFFGLSYGGTYRDDKIFLCVKDSLSGYDSKYIEKAFHHEFSSILYNNYSFDERQWESINHSEFSYGDGGIAALKTGSTGLEFDVKYNKMGFLNEYSTASFEEDFNEICSNLLAPSKRFRNLINDYPRIRKKVNMAVDFYSKINPVFTEEYFTGLVK